MLWLLESGLVAIARLLLYLRLLGQVTNLFPQLTRRLSAGEQSEKLRGAVPWLEDTDIPSDWDQANRFRMRATKAIHDHDMQPRTGLVDELERRLEQAERAEGEKPSPEQVKALALRMAEQRQIDPWQAQPPQRRGHGR